MEREGKRKRKRKRKDIIMKKSRSGGGGVYGVVVTMDLTIVQLGVEFEIGFVSQR